MYLSEGPMGQSESVRNEQEADRHYGEIRKAAADTRRRIDKMLSR